MFRIFGADSYNVEGQTERPVAASHSAGRGGGKERRGRRSSAGELQLNPGRRGPTLCSRSRRIITTSRLHSSPGVEGSNSAAAPTNAYESSPLDCLEIKVRIPYL